MKANKKITRSSATKRSETLFIETFQSVWRLGIASPGREFLPISGWLRSAQVIRKSLPMLADHVVLTNESSHAVHKEVMETWASLPE